MITIPGRIPIHIHPIFWLFILLISSLNSHSPFTFVSWALVIVVSVLIHEMGHALTALAFGQKVKIELVAFGGLTHRQGKSLPAWKDFLIVLNGPLAGLMLALVCFGLLKLPLAYTENVYFLLQLFTAANIFWTILNLAPVQPLDGGHLLRIMLEKVFGVRGVRAAFFIGILFSILASIYFFTYYKNFLMSALCLMLTYENYKAWKTSLSLSAKDQDPALQRLFRQAQTEILHGNEEGAIQRLELIRKKSPTGILFAEASKLLADVLSKQAEWEKAYQLLEPIQAGLTPQGLLLLQDLACHTSRWDEAAKIGVTLYQLEPSYQTAVLNALCHAHMQETQAAVGWLKCAIKDGLPDPANIFKMTEFDAIRQDPLFRKLSENL